MDNGHPYPHDNRRRAHNPYLENRQLRFENDNEYQRPRCSLADDYHGGSEGLKFLTSYDLLDVGFQDIDAASPILEVHQFYFGRGLILLATKVLIRKKWLARTT